MGIQNKQVFEYDFEGKYIRKWNSENDFRKNYYTTDLGIRPLFENEIKGYKYHITHKDTIALLKRPGRDFIKFMLKIYNSKFCNLNNNEGAMRPIQMFNLNDELLAEFSSLRIAELILIEDYSRGTIASQLARTDKKTKGLIGDIYFKYKNN